MKTVIIVNGKPRAGKDSTVRAMANILQANGVKTGEFSSIDPVRWMLRSAGFDLEAKTPEDRALLAEVGDSVEKHSQWRSQRCFREIYNFFDDTTDGPAVMFLHVREIKIIERISEKIHRRGWQVLHVFVESHRQENVTSNAADLGVEGMSYHATIQNNGSLDDLARACDKLLFTNGLISQLSLLHC